MNIDYPYIVLAIVFFMLFLRSIKWKDELMTLLYGIIMVTNVHLATRSKK